MAYQPFTSLNPTAPNFGLAGAKTNPQKSGFIPSITAESTPAYKINPMGVSAVSPQNNVTSTSNAIPPKQMKPTVTPPVSQVVPPTPKPNPSTPTPQTPPQTANTISSFPGLVGTLANTAAQSSPQVQQAQSELQRYRDAYGNAQAGLSMGGTDFNYLQGTENNLANQYQQGLASRTQAVQNALTQQGQQISGLGTAAGLASPQNIPYTSQAFYPVEGQSVTGGNNPQSQASSLAQDVLSGRRTIDDAHSAMGNNQYFNSLIDGAVRQGNPSYNFTQSNASGQTVGQGQGIQTSANSANAALDSLSNAFGGLNFFQTQGIPATTSIANWIEGAMGQQGLTQYKTALNDARSQLVGVLNSSGGTPTGNEQTALSYLPDNMTAGQFETNVGTPQNPGIVRKLIQQKAQAFSTSGQQPNTGQQGQASGSIYDF